jgi:hypothetical protein
MGRNSSEDSDGVLRATLSAPPDDKPVTKDDKPVTKGDAEPSSAPISRFKLVE